MCISCGRHVQRAQMGIIFRRDSPGYPQHTYHALCIELTGGALLDEARELWADLGHTETWDAMIVRQRALNADGERAS